ncbi:hypothetical protein chiPu_0014776 [Chiloscyllium punctatum]|uniref:Uncharacterized protein n=1 Tax=Chiloscyllium punctatum TaxID=137246 RepID=A0A401T0V6_CHIPU|nr:hypothetical protein [Chiloscyllium punctatum]
MEDVNQAVKAMDVKTAAGPDRFEGESVAVKMYKFSKLKVLEKIWNPNINRQLGEDGIIVEDIKEEMEECSKLLDRPNPTHLRHKLGLKLKITN